MKKFTKTSKIKEDGGNKKDKILYEDDIRKIISISDDGWSLVEEKDFIAVIPYLIESNQIILRHEVVPTFDWDSGKKNCITILSGGIEEGETAINALLREVEEEAGIVVRDGIDIEISEPLYANKGTSSKFYFCILPLSDQDFHEIKASGDGSKIEKMSKSFKLDIKKLSSFKPCDLVAAYVIEKFKRYINL